MRFHLLLLPFLLGSSAHACLNDRDSDSLALQAAQFPDTLRVITGRFERQPPLFYEMRIQRSLAQLKKTPREFGLYDDIGVAFDKLHRDDEALKIMAKKRALLPPFDAKNPAMKEAWYRYYANTGTFHAHRFMGRKTADLSEMKLARAMIKRAIEIKPNAHFGREKYQLMAMDWILAVKSKKSEASLGGWVYPNTEKEQKQTIEGLSGLIVLGAAWESVDVFHALNYPLQTKEGITLSYLALLRTQELLNQGHKSLAPKEVNPEWIRSEMLNLTSSGFGAGLNAENQETLQKLFPKLRAEAERWNSQRQNYMLTRLQKGDHPDTNAKFWATWKPAAPPSLEVNWLNSAQQQRERVERNTRRMKIAGALVLAGTLALTLGLLWRFSKKRRLAV